MRTGKDIGLSLLVFLLSVGGLRAEGFLASKALVDALVQEVSGERAYDYAVAISGYDRIQAGEGWHDAALMIKKTLEKMGYRDVELEGWPSNGSRTYATYRTPIGWRARRAELWMTAPEKQRLCSYAEIPLTLVKHSNSADVEAELVDVGTGVGEAAYQGKDVRGKVVLATAYTGTVMREAVIKRGALGVITWYPPETRPGYPDMIRYTAIWPRWEERERIGFGFNVSKEQGWLLKKALEEGKRVVLKALVEAEYYEGRIEVLSASYPGSIEPEKEVLIVGHLCHPRPSSNDNASGSGGMLEMAGALRRMVDKGLINPPRRTIRFLWVPEFAGTIPYVLAHLERTRNTLSAINCDMIGEDLHKTGGAFNITCTPDSLPSYLNDVVVDFARLVEKLNLRSMNGSRHPFLFRVLPYSGGSDHVIFNDGSIRVPSVMLGHGDVFHHTSLDTPDKMDRSELRRVCSIALGVSCYLAAAGEGEARAMARLIAGNGLGRLSRDFYDRLEAMSGAGNPASIHESYRQVLNVVRHSRDREVGSILSVMAFASDPGSRAAVKREADNIEALASVLEEDAADRYRILCREQRIRPARTFRTSEEEKLGKIIPRRGEDFVAPLQRDYVEDKLGEQAFQGVDLDGNAAYEALNFADGKRSVLEIAEAVSAEFGRVDPGSVLAFFRVLEKAGLVTLQ